jgi:hypothetical protein
LKGFIFHRLGVSSNPKLRKLIPLEAVILIGSFSTTVVNFPGRKGVKKGTRTATQYYKVLVHKPYKAAIDFTYCTSPLLQAH